MKLEMKLVPQREPENKPTIYNIVAGMPLKGGTVQLYLAPADLREVFSYAQGSTLEEAIPKLFQEAIDRLDETEQAKPDFLGWPAFFMSVGFTEAGGDNFFGYDPFITYPIPQEALLQFVQLYTDRVEKVMRRKQQPG